MRILIAGVALALLSGCVSIADLEKTRPALQSASLKTPNAYAKCLAPAWQDMNEDVSSTETEYGYRLLLKIDMVGVPVMATIAGQGSGSLVKVYTRNSTWNAWVDVAKKCL
ncbi:hypothetical protein [Pseudomonas protegens]|uniref:hypothetical protein n=1 Tax=Pseudomonas protegens TaxID=380021 RepID=UPI001F317876|nr:hypothetical protein [Pseudomonas protegens]